jgi:hypothetical protein
MDHHCPWIANCVGHFNYKFFFLMIFYGMSCLGIISATFWESLYIAVHDENRSPYLCFTLMMMYSLCVMLNVVVAAFFVFHCYLIYNNYSTIEF